MKEDITTHGFLPQKLSKTFRKLKIFFGNLKRMLKDLYITAKDL